MRKKSGDEQGDKDGPAGDVPLAEPRDASGREYAALPDRYKKILRANEVEFPQENVKNALRAEAAALQKLHVLLRKAMTDTKFEQVYLRSMLEAARRRQEAGDMPHTIPGRHATTSAEASAGADAGTARHLPGDASSSGPDGGFASGGGSTRPQRRGRAGRQAEEIGATGEEDQELDDVDVYEMDHATLAFLDQAHALLRVPAAGGGVADSASDGDAASGDESEEGDTSMSEGGRGEVHTSQADASGDSDEDDDAGSEAMDDEFEPQPEGSGGTARGQRCAGECSGGEDDVDIATLKAFESARRILQG